MTAYDFSLVKNTSFAFSASAGDSINFGSVDAASLSVTETTTGLVIVSGTDRVTLEGASLAQLTTTNVTFGTASDRSAWVVGDNATNTNFDGGPDTIDIGSTPTVTGFAATQANADSLVYGLGGGDTITVGNGNNVIFGGSGRADTSDGGDAINIGSAAGVGGNTVYGNAGADVVTYAFATAAGTTNTLYLGLGNDSINDSNAAHAGDFVVYGNSGNDTVDLSALVGDATIYGGNGKADSTDTDDTITIGAGSATIYGNSGNDTINTGATAATDTVNIFGGTGDDSISVGATVAASKTVIYGGDADADVITFADASEGDATIFGGLGIASANDGADTITLGEGSALVYANAGADTVNLTSGLQDSKSVVIHTGAGNDTVNVTTAQDSGAGDTGDGASVTLYSNAGDDTFNINNNGTANVEYQFAFADFADGDVINITLDGGAAATALSVDGGGSSLSITDGANQGKYVFTGYTGNLNETNFVISGGSRLVTNFSTTATTLTGSATAADYLISGDAADTLVGNETATGVVNKYEGNAGNDVFQIDDAIITDLNNTTQTISGGTGTDTLEITGSSAITLAANDFIAALTSIEIIKLSNIDNHGITLADANQSTLGLTTIDGSALTGTKNFTLDDNQDFAAGLTITGGAGADLITRDTATAHSDNMSLGGGNDVLTTINAQFTSGDTLDGGTGTNSIVFTDAITLADTAFTNVTNFQKITLAAATEDTFSSIASQMDEAGIATIDGSAKTGTNSLVITTNTSSENMSISGGAGSDTLVGGTGNDTLVGGLSEAATGSAGQNVLTGGTGANHFVINSLAATDGTQITDFLTGTNNVLDFSLATFTGMVGATEYINTTAALDLLDFSAGTDANSIIVINDVGYANVFAAWSAIDGGTTEAANDDAILIFYDTDGGYASVFYEDALDDNFNNTPVEIARLTDLDSLADFQAAFDSANGTTVAEVALVA